MIYAKAIGFALLLGTLCYFIGRRFLIQSQGSEPETTIKKERWFFLLAMSLPAIQSTLKSIGGESIYFINAIFHYAFILTFFVIFSPETRIAYKEGNHPGLYKWRKHSFLVFVIMGSLYGFFDTILRPL